MDNASFTLVYLYVKNCNLFTLLLYHIWMAYKMAEMGLEPIIVCHLQASVNNLYKYIKPI